MKLALLLIALPAAVLSQNAGTQKQEQPLPITWSECTAPGSCTQKVGRERFESFNHISCYIQFHTERTL